MIDNPEKTLCGGGRYNGLIKLDGPEDKKYWFLH